MNLWSKGSLKSPNISQFNVYNFNKITILLFQNSFLWDVLFGKFLNYTSNAITFLGSLYCGWRDCIFFYSVSEKAALMSIPLRGCETGHWPREYSAFLGQEDRSQGESSHLYVCVCGQETCPTPVTPHSEFWALWDPSMHLQLGPYTHTSVTSNQCLRSKQKPSLR